MFDLTSYFLEGLLKFQKSFLEEVSFKLLFILEKNLLKKNFTISLTSTTKSSFTLSYQNKTHSPKLTFDIFKLNKNHSFKRNSSKRPSFKKLSFKRSSLKKLNQTDPKQSKKM